MPNVHYADRFTIRLGPSYRKKVEEFARERGMQNATAIRYIIEEHFDREPQRLQDRKSTMRMLEIMEYLFASAFKMNGKTMTQEERRAVMIDTAECIEKYHPLRP